NLRFPGHPFLLDILDAEPVEHGLVDVPVDAGRLLVVVEEGFGRVDREAEGDALLLRFAERRVAAILEERLLLAEELLRQRRHPGERAGDGEGKGEACGYGHGAFSSSFRCARYFCRRSPQR